MREQHTEYHVDGSIQAKGETINGVPEGHWEWFRLDGTRMRSGFFKDGEQTGEWTTYDMHGQIYKVTTIQPIGVNSELANEKPPTRG